MFDEDEVQMHTDKTPRQANADKLLLAALEECIEAYLGEEASEYTLTDFLALTAMQKITEQGVIVTKYPLYIRDGDIPWYKIQGLMKVHQIQMDQENMSRHDNG